MGCGAENNGGWWWEARDVVVDEAGERAEKGSQAHRRFAKARGRADSASSRQCAGWDDGATLEALPSHGAVAIGQIVSGESVPESELPHYCVCAEDDHVREASETSLCRHTMTFLVPLAMLPPNDACCTNLESSALLLECPCIVVVSSAVLVLLLVVHKIHVAIPMLWRSRFTSASHSPSWSRT